MKRLSSLWSALTGRRAFEENMSEELRFHIDEYTNDLVNRGLSPEEAARRARLEFGQRNTIEEHCRQSRGLQPFDELVRQVRHSARLLRKTPGFTATALITLAVCLAANLTIFAVVDSILLRPLPFPHADRLVTIFNTYPKAGVDRDGSSTANYYERRAKGTIPAFDQVSIYRNGTAVVGEPGATERSAVLRVSPEFFSTLEAAPALGRSFTEEETTPQLSHVVMLSDPYWRQHFHSDPAIVGTSLRVDGIPYTIVGVLSPNFRFLSSEARLYFPYASSVEDRDSLQRHSGGNSKHLIARLAQGASVDQAQAQIDAQNANLELRDPQGAMMAGAGFRSLVAPLHADHVASIRPVLLWTQAGALALLLIGAVNLTNLLLIRASSRVKETAVRQALGASRLHIVSEVIVETTLLTVLGGLLGLAAGSAGIHLLSTLGADRLPLGSHIAFDTRVALIALAGAAALGLLLSIPIVWFNLRGQLNSAMQAETRGGTPNRAAQTLRHGFIVVQIAIALILLSGAGLLGLSLERALEVSPGFRPDHVLTGQISVPWSKYQSWSARLTFNQRLLQDLSRQPGIMAAGIVNNVPFSGNNGKSSATVKGHVNKPGESARGHYGYGVDGDYFTVLGYRLLEGRFLNADDSRRSARACVVDEDFARYYWPNTSALGQHLFSGSDVSKDDQSFTVVGVVAAVKQAGLTDQSAQGAVYYPYALRTDDSIYVVIRGSLSPDSLRPALQNTVRQIDPEIPVNDLRSMDTRISDSLVAQRSPALLAGLFSMIAILLVGVGTYGVLSYAVAQRRREIGLRMALGACPDHIRRQFLGLALRLLAGGTLFGMLGSWLTGRAMQSLLFQVPVLPATTFIAVGVIAVVSLVACLVPSLRAAAISPMEALGDQ